ncbi:MAG TPA: TlpA disulfide reductase family protein [Casimicrobiaceae bacterium]|jgi:thiol-disulfide isomerase/thioredoxin
MSERTHSWTGRRWVRWGSFVAAGLLALIVGVHVARDGLGWGDRQKAATALLAVELPDAAGQLQRMDQWRGRVLVVNFWATWCVPCREEMPQFIRTQADEGGKGLQFVGIAVDSADKVAKFSKDIGLNYPTLVGGLGAMDLSRDLGNRLMALPFTIVLDRNGRVVHTQLGVLKLDKLHEVVDPLLSPAG